MDHATLQVIWFLLFFVLIIGYALLDGFDLGVGVLHLFAKNEHERRVNLNAIGPVWDGNEVWLLTGGGALFAAFPVVYATVFSGFYLALVLVLLALIMRAVSMEFRHQVKSPSWARMWDWLFGIGSLLPALLFGVAVGNILRGVPINADQTWGGSFLGLLNPYALLVGVTSLILFVMHGATYMAVKSEGEQRDRMQRWALGAWLVFTVLFVLTALATFLTLPHLTDGKLGSPLGWVFAILLVLSIATVPLMVRKQRDGLAFIGSSGVILSAIALAAVGLFPRLVPSLTNLDYSLTITNASSSQNTLSAMFIIALIGMPIVLAYTSFIYYVFKGKVVLDEHSY